MASTTLISGPCPPTLHGMTFKARVRMFVAKYPRLGGWPENQVGSAPVSDFVDSWNGLAFRALKCALSALSWGPERDVT
jgi:hypothetical protein